MAPEPERKQRVLVVEDEIDLSTSLSYALGAAGYEAQTADRGSVALAALESFRPDIVLLDLMLPDVSGLDVCRQLRKNGGISQPAVIIVSARAQEIDRVVGLEVGADDYVVKPFSVRELMLRVEARLKARKALMAASTGTSYHLAGRSIDGTSESFLLRNLRLDGIGHRLFVDHEEVHVSPLEMKLLMFLFQAPGRMRTRRELFTEVWQYAPDVSSRTIDTHVKRLRDKLGTAADLLQTIRGVGFRLADPGERDGSKDVDDGDRYPEHTEGSHEPHDDRASVRKHQS
jgi:two-component system, OmpR family, phosphate regulon response regulator PhoB